MERYDAAILGTGPAGVSAAVTLKIRNKSVLLIGKKDMSLKMAKAHTILNYPGLYGITGSDLADRMKEHLDRMEIAITEDKINTVYAMGEYFALQGAEVMYEAATVILATGVVLAKPFDGEMEYLGKGVSYCATCDAPLYRGKTAAVVGYSKKEEAEADFLAEIADKVYYLPQYPEEVKVSDAVTVIRDKPLKITGEETVTGLETSGGTIPVDGVFLLRESVVPSQLMPGLETEGGHVRVNRQMETNLAGCFACGDVTGLPYQYIKAAGEGNVAAISAAQYLDQKKRNAAQ